MVAKVTWGGLRVGTCWELSFDVGSCLMLLIRCYHYHSLYQVSFSSKECDFSFRHGKPPFETTIRRHRLYSLPVVNVRSSPYDTRLEQNTVV